MAKRTDIIGLRDLERSFRELGKVPQTVATQSARAGARIVQRAAKANAPEDEGHLKKGIILNREKRRVRGKAVYDVMISPHLNDIFVKISKDGKRAYYPASQEYGFLTRNGRYVPGYRYMRRAVDDNEIAVEKKMVAEGRKVIDRIIRKGR